MAEVRRELDAAVALIKLGGRAWPLSGINCVRLTLETWKRRNYELGTNVLICVANRARFLSLDVSGA